MDPADAGHFTTFQVRGGRAQGLALHLDRLAAASRELYGSVPGRRAVRSAIGTALAEAGPPAVDCTLRVRVHPPRAGYRGHHLPPGRPDPALRVEADVQAPRHPPASPIRVRAHAGLRERPGVKHLALDFQRQARRAARAAGFDDALLLAADGRISEGTFWNIVLLDDGGWVWPDAPALPGITMALLRSQLRRAAAPQRESLVDLSAVAGMQAAFALNSTGIVEIAAIDGHELRGDARAGASLRELLAAVAWDSCRAG